MAGVSGSVQLDDIVSQLAVEELEGPGVEEVVVVEEPEGPGVEEVVVVEEPEGPGVEEVVVVEEAEGPGVEEVVVVEEPEGPAVEEVVVVEEPEGPAVEEVVVVVEEPEGPGVILEAGTMLKSEEQGHQRLCVVFPCSRLLRSNKKAYLQDEFIVARVHVTYVWRFDRKGMCSKDTRHFG
eukprot:Em0020g176a